MAPGAIARSVAKDYANTTFPSRVGCRDLSAEARNTRMATNLESRPTARTFDVEQLVDMAWRGRVRVPHFQRGLRWNWEDVKRLFDSILKGYPIGSLLLWTRRANAEVITLGALQLDAPEFDEAFWVVDGQQRLTSFSQRAA